MGLEMGTPRLNPGTSHLELCGLDYLLLSLNVNFLVCNMGKYPCVLLYYVRLPGRGLIQCEFRMRVSNIVASLDMRHSSHCNCGCQLIIIVNNTQ